MAGPVENEKGGSGQDWRLAEYVALRAESLQCSQYMSVLFSLLIATTGVVLGVALRIPIGATPGNGSATLLGPSQSAPLLVLLVLPVVSYLISTRYTYLYLSTLRIGQYIKQEREPTPGHIGWEMWLSDVKMRGPRVSQTLSEVIAFVGTSLLGVGGALIALGDAELLKLWDTRTIWALRGLTACCILLSILTTQTVIVREKARRTLSRTRVLVHRPDTI